jgi:hypothetical protein
VSRFVDPARAFRAWGFAGLAAAVVVGFGTAAGTGLELATLAGIAAIVATFLALAKGSELAGGSVRLVYYHHELSILAVTWALLLALRRPPLAYFDATILSVGAFLAFGRTGCLMAGCCHGQPAGRGVRYGSAHAVEGFPEHLVGVPLAPVQAVEATGVAAIVAAGVPIALHAPPGTALTWYVAAYGVLRFALELGRGDAERPYWLGFSQAQWYSVALVAGSVAGGLAGTLPLQAWDVATVAALAAAMVALVAVRRAPGSAHRLCSSRHTAELAALLATMARTPQPDVHLTSLGLRISAGAGGPGDHFTLSSEGPALTRRQARALARLISRLRGVDAARLIPGVRADVYHVLMAAPGHGTPTSASSRHSVP